MIYAVEKYMDVLKVKPERETVFGFDMTREPKYHYFDTEREAIDFILRRARIKLENAEADARRAKRQFQKLQRKYGQSLPQPRSEGRS